MSVPTLNNDEELPPEVEARTDQSANIAVKLADHTLYVLPQKQWRTSAMKALRSGDFDTWAESSLTEESYDDWLDVDPTIEEVEAFFEQYNDASGVDVSKSRASRRASNRSQRR